MIELRGLSAQQQALCARLWALDTTADLLEFKLSLSPDQQADCDIVLLLMLAANLDEAVTEPRHCEQARAVLAEFMS